MSRILITGASGFIGTNLLEDLLSRGHIVRNIDLSFPKIEKRIDVWDKVDICDFDDFSKAVLTFQPEYIIHLAARTDLDGTTLKEYAANIQGVENLLETIRRLPKLKKIILASSKFVTRNGYQIKNQHDYCPHTKYGESKVETERLIWSNKPHCDWCIIRPTSIWGSWFGVPYRDFFDMVMKKMYFHIGDIKCYKTYGYIGNTVYQIEQLLFTETLDEENKVFYLGDEPAYEINEWADEIAHELGFKIPTMPVWIVQFLAKIGDLLNLFGIHFPMQSFRFYNMTNDGINDLTNIVKIAPLTPYTRLKGTKETIKWIENTNRNRNNRRV